MPIFSALLLLLILPASLSAATLSSALLKEFSVTAKVQGKTVPSASLALEKSLELPLSDLIETDGTPAADIDISLLNESLPDSDIPLTLNSKVNYFINFFQHKGHGFFAKWLSRSERYIPIMKEILRKEGMPEDLVYLAMIESGFTPHAVSVANAVGPWQFISGTGRLYGLERTWWEDERLNPEEATRAAARHRQTIASGSNSIAAAAMMPPSTAACSTML